MEEQFGGFLGVPGTLLEGSGGGLGEVLGMVLVVLEGFAAQEGPKNFQGSSQELHETAPRSPKRLQRPA